MAGTCEACRLNITVAQKRIKCTRCSSLYHSECINFSNDSAPRSQWKCPICVAGQRKGGNNSSTPVCNTAKPVKELSSPTASKSQSSPASTMATTVNLASMTNECDIVAKIERILDSKLQTLKNEMIKELRGSLAVEFRKELTAVTDKFERLESSHASLQIEHAALKRDFDSLQKKTLEEVDKITDLQGQLNKQQQWARMSNIEIVGLPETPKESPVDLALKIASHAGVLLQPAQVESVYRVQPMKKIDGRPKPIVVRLQTKMLKDQIISGLRKTKGISTRDIGLAGTNVRFFVNEHLTPYNKQLLNAAKSRAKDKSYKFVWVRNCNIFLRKNEESPVVTIGSEKDIQKIV